VTYGIHVEKLDILPEELPLEIRNCAFTNLKTAIELVALNPQTRQPRVIERIIIRGNRIYECNQYGIAFTGQVNHVAIVENRVGMCGDADIFIEGILAGSGQILVANNTLHNRRGCLRVMDPIAEVPDLHIVNNLILSDTGPDMAYLGADPQVLAGWRIANNYRQLQPPESTDELQRWLPFENDRIGERLGPVSLEPQSPDFLVAPRTADLSINEALNHLPGYIGAVPPENVQPWDWTTTWKELSKEPRD
jgi:hypothetical protein